MSNAELLAARSEFAEALDAARKANGFTVRELAAEVFLP
jgi:hypothetical protein